jgi:hypothetical protein
MAKATEFAVPSGRLPRTVEAHGERDAVVYAGRGLTLLK